MGLALALVLLMSVQAVGDETVADVQCVIVGARLSELGDPNQRLTAGMLMIYYLGRLDGRVPSFEIESLVDKEIDKMTPGIFAHETRRCSDEFSAKGIEVTRIGHEISRREK